METEKYTFITPPLLQLQAFTLAEILITLVILGIIAAFTIPTAINNTKEQELKSQFAKAYSTISQALYKTEMNDFYGYAKCFYGKDGIGTISDDCPAFFSALTKNLQVQKVCAGNSLSKGCVPTYKTPHGSGDGCSGLSQNYIENINRSYVLSNGQILIVWGYNSWPLFLIDINGHKGPNALGKDLFPFIIERTPNTGLYTNKGTCDVGTGGRTTEEMIRYSLAGKK